MNYETIVDKIEYEINPNKKTATVKGYKYDPLDFERGTITHLSIPRLVDGCVVDAIADRAFEFAFFCEIILPDTIKSIGKYSFANSLKLEKITLPKGVTVVSERAFYKCIKLHTVVLGDDVETIEEFAFGLCNSLRCIKLNNNLKKIGNKAFTYSGLESIVLYENIREIGDEVFLFCDKLRVIEILSDKVKKIGKMIVGETPYYNNKANWVQGVLYINNCLIKIKRSLTEAVIKEETSSFADDAFDGNRLKTLTINNSKFLCDKNYKQLKSLKRLILNKNILEFKWSMLIKHSKEIESVIIDRDNPNFQSDWQGIVYNRASSKMTICYIPGVFSEYNTVYLPNGVKEIPESLMDRLRGKTIKLTKQSKLLKYIDGNIDGLLQSYDIRIVLSSANEL